MEHVDCVVIGAGVVGLAVARSLALNGREVLVLEKAAAVGTETSSRNSEVIHAGLYYTPGSWKARLCTEGREQLYAYCTARGVEHRRLGKLIVATEPSELAALATIRSNAVACGVLDLSWLEAPETRGLEPAVRGVGALFSPSTGIVDSHGLMLALLADAQAGGALLALRSPVTAGRVTDRGIVLRVGGEEPSELLCRSVVNCAGLSAPWVARALSGLPEGAVPRDYLCKGNYFLLGRRAPFRHLVYPAPEQAGLGIHLTLDLGGQARFGPDVEWVAEVDYRVDPDRAGRFYEAVRRYWPEIREGDLKPGFSGIRPKIRGPGEPAADFCIQGPDEHGVEGLVNLFGIESPGLTACLALASEAARRIERSRRRPEPRPSAYPCLQRHPRK